jgi:hypothetical protein
VLYRKRNDSCTREGEHRPEPDDVGLAAYRLAAHFVAIVRFIVRGGQGALLNQRPDQGALPRDSDGLGAMFLRWTNRHL